MLVIASPLARNEGNCLEQVEWCTPLTIKMEPKDHPLEKEYHLPNPHDFGFQQFILRGCILIFKHQNPHRNHHRVYQRFGGVLMNLWRSFTPWKFNSEEVYPWKCSPSQGSEGGSPFGSILTELQGFELLRTSKMYETKFAPKEFLFPTFFFCLTTISHLKPKHDT